MVNRKRKDPFDVQNYLETAGVKRKIVDFRKGQIIFTQGDESRSVFYVQSGSVKITVNSSAGKEAVIALLQPGDFFRRRLHRWPAPARFRRNRDGPHIRPGN